MQKTVKFNNPTTLVRICLLKLRELRLRTCYAPFTLLLLVTVISLQIAFDALQIDLRRDHARIYPFRTKLNWIPLKLCY